MEYRTMLRLQKCLYFNIFLFLVWVVVVSFFLCTKINILGHLMKYLTLTVFTLLVTIESARLYLGYYGNSSRRVPELAGFILLTSLMQMPLISFFLFNPYLLSTPTEFVLHACLWCVSLAEMILSFLALKQASSIAKSIYLKHSN